MPDWYDTGMADDLVLDIDDAEEAAGGSAAPTPCSPPRAVEKRAASQSPERLTMHDEDGERMTVMRIDEEGASDADDDDFEDEGAGGTATYSASDVSTPAEFVFGPTK